MCKNFTKLMMEEFLSFGERSIEVFSAPRIEFQWLCILSV